MKQSKGKNWKKHRDKVRIRHIKKKQDKYNKYNKRIKRNLLKNPDYNYKKRNQFKKKILELEFPEIVKFNENFEETAAAFEKLVNIMSNQRAEIECFFNIENVLDIGTDVVMYMVALISNLKISKRKKITFSGNLPNDDNSRKKMINTGFLNYVHIKNKQKICEENLETKSRIQITNGKTTSPEQSAKVVSQLSQILGKEYTKLYDLYDCLIELKNNTIEHAYNRSKRFETNEWYLYTEEFENYIEYIFLDTGPGIPDTVYKKYIFEEINLTRPIIGGDAKLIKSALNGEFRSKTRKSTRGNGLPRIKQAVKEGIFEDMVIYSGKGECYISKENKSIQTINHKNKFEGTLFKWKIMKEIDIYE